MPYLLNLIYLLLILISLPWLLWQAVRKGKYREGYAAKFLGHVPVRTSANSRELTAPGGMRTDLDGRENASGTAPGAVSSRLFQSCEKTCLWLHAVSVGEVNLLEPLLKMIEQQRPDWECVISTTTATGMALAKKKYPRQTVFYCPLDFSWAVSAAMRRIRPDVLVLAELELWPNLIRAARQTGARVAVINGRLSEHSFHGYRRIRPLVARLLRQLDVVAAQDETYAERFRLLGTWPERVCVTGSMKYDGAQTDRANPITRRLAALAGFAENDIVLLAGSTQEPEEAMALDAFRELSPQWPRLRLVLVPRHPERFEAVAKLLDSSGIVWKRRTTLEGRGTGDGGREEEIAKCKLQIANCKLSDSNPKSQIPNQQISNPQSLIPNPSPLPSPLSPRILLVDVVGELGAWWGTAQIAFVGGSLGSRGGQNMIEPAAYGAAVSFGPNTWNFRDIVAMMLARDAAVVVENGERFTAFVRRCLQQPDHAAALGERAKMLVLSQLGATQRTFQILDALVQRRFIT